MSTSFRLIDTGKTRHIRSAGYNFDFRRSDGLSVRWGRTIDDDPDFCPFGPEILDIEISTSVNNPDEFKGFEDELVRDGGCKGKCPWCYKRNSEALTHNMPFSRFKHVLDSMLGFKEVDGRMVPTTPLTQLAFGIMNIGTNLELFRMAEYARSVGVIPNVTIHGLDYMDASMAKCMKEHFGAVAVSVYDKEKSYGTVRALCDAGMKQVNIHLMYCEERKDFVLSVLDDVAKDSRLSGLHAVVLLALKQKGGGTGFTRISDSGFSEIVGKAVGMADSCGASVGFDSCTCHRFVEAYRALGKDASGIESQCEPCEACCFSSYVNSRGEYFPCSFCEGVPGWEHGIPVGDDFIEIWKSQRVGDFRASLIGNGRKCPVYEV